MPVSPSSRLIGEGRHTQSYAGDKRRVRRYITHFPPSRNGSSPETQVEAVVKDTKKPGYEKTAGGDGVSVEYDDYPGIGSVELKLGRGLSPEAKDVCLDGLNRTLEEIKEIEDAQ